MCQHSRVPNERGRERGRLTFKELAAVSLTGLEFDRDDVTEGLVQELDGNTLSSCISPDEVERAVQPDEDEGEDEDGDGARGSRTRGAAIGTWSV